MNVDYDDWIASCSNGSSPRSRSLCSAGSKLARSVARLLSIPCLIVIGFVALVCGCASGCGSRTVLVPETSPVRIGPETKTRVYTLVEGDWRLSQNSVVIPEGWYCVPPSFVEKPHD